LLEQAVKKSLTDPIASRYGGPGYQNKGWKTVTIGRSDVRVWQGPPSRLQPVPPDIGGGPPVQMAVKGWAELSDRAGNLSGQFVNVEMFRWQPGQRFYFWLESPIPIQVSLFQYYDILPLEARTPRLVSPDPAFPNTYATVVPGQPFRFPQLFRTDLSPF